MSSLNCKINTLIALFVLFFSCYILNYSAQEIPPKKLDLKETLTFAIKNAPEIDSSRREMHIRDLELKNAYYQFFPSIQLSADHGVGEHFPQNSEDTNWESQYQLSISETLYNNGKNLTNYQIFKAQKNISEITYWEVRDKLCLTLVGIFFQYSLSLKFYDVQKDEYELLDQKYRSIKSMYQQGLKTREDFLRFDAERKQAEIDLLDRKNNIEKSYWDLLNAMGVHWGKGDHHPYQFKPDHSEKVDFPKLNDQSLSIEKNHTVRLKHFNDKIDKLKLSLAKKGCWPEISITSGLTYQNHDYFNGDHAFYQNETTQLNVMLNFKYTLWDWGIKHRNIEIEKENKAIRHNTSKSEILNVRSSLNKLLLDLRKLKKDYTLTQKLLELEQKTFTYIQSEYRNGKIPYLDLIEALNKLSAAREGYYSALYTLKETIYEYWYQKGELYEKIF